MRGTTTTILILEDCELMCCAVARAFRRQGWDTILTSTCAEALAHAEPFDVAVLDLELPDGSGLTVGHELKPHTPIVFFTGARDAVTQCASVGDVVCKTAGVKVLVERVRAKLATAVRTAGSTRA